MKKTTAILLVFALVFALASCTGSGEPTDRASTGENTSISAESVSAATESEALENDAGVQKVLVAYFSATGTTKGVAQQIAGGLSCDLYEITPQDPYTDADLNYSDANSRTTSEMNDEKHALPFPARFLIWRNTTWCSSVIRFGGAKRPESSAHF